MGKFLVEIECPEGYEPAYGKDSLRLPKRGELFVTTNGMVVTTTHDFKGNKRKLIVRPAWQWPKWLKARWIAMDYNGSWYAYEHEPILTADCWTADVGRFVELIESDIFDFSPPPCDHYRNSLRHNPYLEMDE